MKKQLLQLITKTIKQLEHQLSSGEIQKKRRSLQEQLFHQTTKKVGGTIRTLRIFKYDEKIYKQIRRLPSYSTLTKLYLFRAFLVNKLHIKTIYISTLSELTNKARYSSKPMWDFLKERGITKQRHLEDRNFKIELTLEDQAKLVKEFILPDIGKNLI